MSRKGYEVSVKQGVYVSLDESKFTPEFMQEFRDSFYDFHSIDEHVEHLAQLFARGLADSHSFIEGYGQASDMGIKLSSIGSIKTEIES